MHVQCLRLNFASLYYDDMYNVYQITKHEFLARILRCCPLCLVVYFELCVAIKSFVIAISLSKWKILQNGLLSKTMTKWLIGSMFYPTIDLFNLSSQIWSNKPKANLRTVFFSICKLSKFRESVFCRILWQKLNNRICRNSTDAFVSNYPLSPSGKFWDNKNKQITISNIWFISA